MASVRAGAIRARLLLDIVKAVSTTRIETARPGGPSGLTAVPTL